MELDPESESDPDEASRNSANGSAGRISSVLRKARAGDTFELDDSTSTSGGGSISDGSSLF